MKTEIIKKSDFINRNRQKLSNILLPLVIQFLITINIVSFGKYELRLCKLADYLSAKSISFYLKK